MNQKMLQAAVLLGQYAKGDLHYLDTLVAIQATGYSEQTAIFLLEILENCIDDPYPNNSMHFPARPELTGEEKPGDSYP